ncbi:glycerate kinase [Propionibacteriaceae bacterium Y1923]
MRVVVATDRYPALSSAQASAVLATAWAEQRAQVAVVPLGNALEGFQEALADLLAASGDLISTEHGIAHVVEAETGDGGLLVAVRPEHVPAGEGIDVEASSVEVGRLVRTVVEQARERGPVERVVLEVGDRPAHDGGAGLLAAWGATADRPLDEGVAALAGITRADLTGVLSWLAGARLDLVVPADEHTRHLVGLRGLTSVRGHAIGLDPASLLSTDQALVDLAAALDRMAQSRAAGAGAAGGLGFAALALGGSVSTGAAYGGDLANLASTIGQADLVVTGAGQLDFGTMGGDVLFTVLALASEALRPVVVVAENNFISPRELRSIGVEAAYSVRTDTSDPNPVDADELLAAAQRIARSWAW